MRPAAGCGGGVQQNASSRRRPGRKPPSSTTSYTASTPTITAPRPARWGSGETLGKILNGFGVSALTIDRLDKASKDIFPLRNIRAGHKYTAFIHEDSLYAPHLDYLVYERNVAEYVVFGFHDDSVSVRTGEKQFTVRRTKKKAPRSTRRSGALSWSRSCPMRWPPKWRTFTSGRWTSSASRKATTSRSSTTSGSSTTASRSASAASGARNSVRAARSTTPFRSGRGGKIRYWGMTAQACASRCSRRR